MMYPAHSPWSLAVLTSSLAGIVSPTLGVGALHRLRRSLPLPPKRVIVSPGSSAERFCALDDVNDLGNARVDIKRAQTAMILLTAVSPLERDDKDRAKKYCYRNSRKTILPTLVSMR